MKRNLVSLLALAASMTGAAHTVLRPVTAADLDTIREKISALSRVHLGGYGEAAFNYDFSGLRTSNADAIYDDARGHADFNLPRIVLMLGVNLGKGWGVETDVQFENCKKVSIDQFWIEKLFTPAAGVRAGYLTLPVGATNAHDDPMEFFGVNRPEGEDAILPCDWHQAGLSFYGEASDWGYEAILIPGLNTSIFSEDEWLALDAAGERFSFSRGRDLAIAARVDNTSIPGLRLSLSGYYGASFNNRLALRGESANQRFAPQEQMAPQYKWAPTQEQMAARNGWGATQEQMAPQYSRTATQEQPAARNGRGATQEQPAARNGRGAAGILATRAESEGSGISRRIKGNVGFLSLDFDYNNYGWILRGNGNWGRYSKSVKSIGEISGVETHHSQAKSAFAAAFEGGYDLFSRTALAEKDQKFYVFGRYAYWQAGEESDSFLGYDWRERQTVGVGVNYKPIPQVVIKAEYSHSFLQGGGRIPMLSIGAAYSGHFF